MVAAKEQIAALRQQLEEANRLKDLAEKARFLVEEDKIKAEKERDEAEQHGYDVGVVETEDALQAEVPVVCRAYCAQTWEEALNQAGVEASSGLRRAESIIFPLALQIPKQAESAPFVPPMTSEAPPQHPPSAAQPEQGVAQETLKGSSPGKVIEAP